MTKEHKSSNNKRPILRKTATAAVVFVVLTAMTGAAMLVYNNISFISDAAFAKRVDTAIESAENWVSNNREDILKEKNIGLLKMLQECSEIKHNPAFEKIVKSFLTVRCQPECWKRLVDPNWPVNQMELNQTMEKEIIDNKWVLYAIATEEAKITPEEMHLFDPQRWQWRQLTHQLNALVILKKRNRNIDENLDELIEHLCERLSNELVFDMAVVDIYIQKVAFVLIAGHPEKIRTRWVERIIANQLPDGGWNDRWFCFTSNKKPVFNSAALPSNQHATVQALTVLYLAKYRYPEHFGLKTESFGSK